MRRAASKCRPADVSLNGYRAPDPSRSRNEVGIEVDNNLQSGVRGRIRPSGATVVGSEAMSARVAPHGVAQGARATGGATSARRAASNARASIGLRGRFSRGRRRSTTVAARTERTDATAASSGDDPAAFIRDFATVALKMQTAALRGVADVPSQLAKQLQRAAAPPPAGFPRALPTTSPWRSARIPSRSSSTRSGDTAMSSGCPSRGSAWCSSPTRRWPRTS